MARFALLQAKKAGNKARRKLTQREKSVNAAADAKFLVPGFSFQARESQMPPQ